VRNVKLNHFWKGRADRLEVSSVAGKGRHHQAGRNPVTCRRFLSPSMRDLPKFLDQVNGNID